MTVSRTRLVLVVLAALLALPLAPAASPVDAKKRPRIVTKTFTNSGLLSLPTFEDDDPVEAVDAYPAAIRVAGLRGPVRDVNVRLNDFSHTHPDDVQVLLVGPDGQTAVVMANVGHYEDVDGVTLRLDDEATAPLPDFAKLQSGAFRPTSRLGGAIAFKPPAPQAGANTALSVFDGASPNGTWRLFVQDATPRFDAGEFVDGWSLEITAKAKAKKKR
jgi:hypothetical protein